ncbi:MAG: MarR family transcriptional regulator [Candidatus Gastranaerophilaceae bacterium]|nr:MarR family transcriptional regulator [Candidatus Gastranaerophilaceae bacterium]
MATNINQIPHYTESIFYELKQLARIMKFHAVQQFAVLNIDLIPEEYTTLDTIMCNPSLCQRDLAKLLLLDRANTGRILNKLEEKNLIKRSMDTKNNRLIKKVQITKKGEKKLNEINNKIIDKYMEISNEIPKAEFESVKLLIIKLRQSIEKHIENKI